MSGGIAVGREGEEKAFPPFNIYPPNHVVHSLYKIIVIKKGCLAVIQSARRAVVWAHGNRVEIDNYRFSLRPFRGHGKGKWF